MVTSRCFRWVVMFAFWTVLGLVFSVQGYMIVSRFHNPDATFWEAIINTLPSAYAWGLLVPIIARLTRRFRLERDSWWRAAGFHLAFGIFCAVVHTLLAVSAFAVLWSAIGQRVKWWPWVQDNWVLFLHWNVVVYAAVVAIVHAMDYYKISRDRERRTLQLETRLAEAQLQALKMQLHPHF